MLPAMPLMLPKKGNIAEIVEAKITESDRNNNLGVTFGTKNRSIFGADVLSYELFLQEAELTKLCSTKSILTANGSFPGPEIRVRRGDTVLVNVHNQGSHAVSIAWEGFKQSIKDSDGLIQPGRNFTYEIKLSDEIGTLWWHAKSAWASATIHGAFVILPAAGESYPFPPPNADQTIVLGSWFKQELTETNAPGKADGFTINGHPGETYACNDSTYHVQVDYGSDYLLRIVNAAVKETMVFGLDYHMFTVVGRDGAYTTRSFANSLTIAPAHTIDVVLRADQNLGRYFMTAKPSSGELLATGIIQYTITGAA
ncbi:Multicopper oxidase, type 1 [Corchorus olitorius]|uniref:Multicopper oxidase, type 1 n=1 Tax=Corchorus olitorius TaxID=93759 RepID=A0A1R3GNF9_9ROSI|nr:Multicopper oxidase, type 1 [Corchorus olitorius]